MELDRWGKPLGAIGLVDKFLASLDKDAYNNPFSYAIFNFFTNRYTIEGDDQLKEIWPIVEMWLFWTGRAVVIDLGKFKFHENIELVVCTSASYITDANFRTIKGSIAVSSVYAPEQRLNGLQITWDDDYSVVFQNTPQALPTLYPYQYLFDLMYYLLLSIKPSVALALIKFIFGVDGEVNDKVIEDFENIYNSKTPKTIGVIRQSKEELNAMKDHLAVQTNYFGTSLVETLTDIWSLCCRLMGIPENQNKKKERNIEAEYVRQDAFLNSLESIFLSQRKKCLAWYNTKFKRNAKIILNTGLMVEEMENDTDNQLGKEGTPQEEGVNDI